MKIATREFNLINTHCFILVSLNRSNNKNNHRNSYNTLISIH